MDNPSITLTPAAILAVKNQLEKHEMPDACLRLGVTGSGCSGFSYVIEFFNGKPRAKDKVFTFDDIKVVIDNKSMIYLNGVTLDFEKTLLKQGFVFINPQEKSKCGCGKSFSI
jgi:iron-sulfur cluster assembly protein